MSITKGPWRWEYNPKSKSIELLTTNGRDIVMDFVRFGTQNASPRFNNDGLMCRADEFAVIEKGREHLKDWHLLIDQPIANAISAVPEMMEALELALEELRWCSKRSCEDDEFNIADELKPAVDKCQQALAKAKGEGDES